VAENLVTDGAATQTPVVDLAGKSMLAIVQAIPELEARTGREAADKERTDLLDIIRLTWTEMQARQRSRSYVRPPRSSQQMHAFTRTDGSLTSRTTHSAGSVNSPKARM
jgi:hypothetical protein